MELILEIFLEIYMELMLLIVPEKRVGKRHRVIATLIAIAVLLTVIALFIWGLALIVDDSNMMGLLPLAIAVLISLAQIVAGIILYNRNH